jgi:Uma2 family endonuclease
MAPRAHVRFRADDIWDTPDDGKRYEVIDGALYVTPPPNWGHQNAIAVLLRFLLPHIDEHQLGKLVPAPVGVTLDEDSGVQPDLVFVSAERLHIICDRGIEGAPDLVVEVLSPRTQSRDRGIKMRRYAAAGVPHYWIVAPRSRSIEAYRLTATGYELTGVHGPDSVFRPDLFPGLEIPVARLWE